jgi:hypothetical protein
MKQVRVRRPRPLTYLGVYVAESVNFSAFFPARSRTVPRDLHKHLFCFAFSPFGAFARNGQKARFACGGLAP